MSRKLTEAEFVARCREVHGDRYRYEGCGYVGMQAPITVTCPVHGPFRQKAQSHVLGHGCRECAEIMHSVRAAKSGPKRRIPADEILARFAKVHGDRYDYSRAKPKGSKSPVTIVCREHGPFEQSVASHIAGSGCPTCGRRDSGRGRRLTQTDFEERARAAHGDLYRLEQAVYTTQYDQVTVVCREHGPFPILPFNLWAGGGCPACARRDVGEAKRLTTEGFVARAKDVHGDLYDYTPTRYTLAVEDVEIVCRDHGPFRQLPHNHLKGYGCPTCGSARAVARMHEANTLSLDDVIARFREAHGDRYDYGQVIYEHSQRHVTIVCRRHGAFRQRPYEHWEGKGCPACGREAQRAWAAANVLSNEEAVVRFRRLHSDRYDYSRVEYRRFREPVEIICRVHGAFRQSPQAHLEGKGCPQCVQSSGEARTAAWLRDRDIAFEVEHRIPIPTVGGERRLARFDFLLPDLALAIEIDGPHHFAPVRYAGMSDEDALRVHEATKRRDTYKDAWAREAGLRVVRIRWDADIEAALAKVLEPS